MAEGTVKFFNQGKHFGFISGDDGKSYFFHESQVLGEAVTEGDRVSFTPGEGDRGPKAENVKKITAAPDSGAEPKDSGDDEASEEQLDSEVAEAEEEEDEDF